MEIGKYCPVCEKVYRESLDFCLVPRHEKVLLIRIRDWGDGYKIYTTKAFDQQDDDFNMDEGLDRDIIEDTGGLTKTQLKKLMRKGQKDPNPLITEWRRRKTDK